MVRNSLENGAGCNARLHIGVLAQIIEQTCRDHVVLLPDAVLMTRDLDRLHATVCTSMELNHRLT